MKVTHVAIRPTEASDAAGRPALTPELLAASGARYSRNNEGLDAILARIDPANLDRSVDSIFKMVDYGHASIADMAPVALFVDGISQWLAYYVWSLCPTASGQESSTRYLRLSEEGLVSPDVLGIPAAERERWTTVMRAAYRAYADALELWEGVVRDDPDAARIPAALQADPSEKARRAVARMRRNFAFDRARYFLPAAAATNVMLIMSARAWVSLIQQLLSHPLPEAVALGEACRAELGLSAPRLLRHAKQQPSLVAGLRDEWDGGMAQAAQRTEVPMADVAPTAFLEVMAPRGATGAAFAADLAHHDNRYAYFGDTLRRTAVRFGWEAVAFAEIRDLNRHRTGSKYCPPVPVGFYYASDVLPETSAEAVAAHEAMWSVGCVASTMARDWMAVGDPTCVYYTLLGTQYGFEHTTTADKFLYEAELRTGTGAHFRYAMHLRDALALWYERYPETRGLILEGSAEPE